MDNIIKLILLFLFFGFIFQKFGKNWKFHLVLNILMYGFFLYLWFIMLIPKSHIEHRGDPGLGFGLLTIWLAPIFILINLFSIFYAKKINDKKIYRINIIALIFCFLHIVLFLIITSIASSLFN